MGSSRDEIVFQSSSISRDFPDLDRLTSDTEFTSTDYDYIGSLKDITKRHWKSVEGRTECRNRSCRKPFSALLERPRHCRRCGEVFCQGCVQYQRRLNKLAHPDPDGQMYKVCKECFELGKLTDGQSCNHTEFFNNIRSWRKSLHTDVDELPSVWKSHLNFNDECERLLTGFKQSIGDSEVIRTLHEMRRMVSLPEWTKSRIWLKENLATCCRVCQINFSFTKKKYFCAVCSICICIGCSSKDLLLYVPDEEKDNGGTWEPKIAIIKIVGCPEKEPEISMYLRVCPSCKDRIEDKQVDAFKDKTTVPIMLLRINEKFTKLENEIKEQLPKYREIAESLEDNTRNTGSQKNVIILAKAQEDLADVLAQHATSLQELKNLRPQTDKQELLLANYIKARYGFYLNNMSDFRGVRHKLSESLPVEILDSIQRVTDKNAIVSAHIVLRKLTYETINLCDKYEIQDSLPLFLTKIEEQIELEVQACLKKEGEDVQKHMELVKNLIGNDLKKKKLMIQISHSQFKGKNSAHVYQFMCQRVEQILKGVGNQLKLRTPGRSFPNSKRSLEKATEIIQQWRKMDKLGKDDFVWVSKNTEL